ncbi:thioredoxin-disulfide reductase [Candidatus Uhrbacteria bacterium]|nr:thioredoxin-disulfide reductase [Candidatus Uhrbacteria bacterium]
MTRSLIIIGGGPSALTAAIYAGRASLKPLVFAGNMPGGQLMLTSEVENFPGFDEPILGPELMERWRKQAARYGAEIEDEDVTAVDFSKQPFRVTAAGQIHESRSVIVATGATAKWLGIPNEQRLIGKGVHTCAQCDGFAYTGKHVVVVGGGDTAMEETTTLAKIAAKVTVVHRRNELRASKIMAERVRQNPKVEFIWNTAVEDVIGDLRTTGVKLKNLETNTVREFPCDGLFVAIGYTPATAFLKGQLELNEKGYVVVHDHTRTTVEGIFAAGDVENFRYRQAVTAAGAGCAAAIDAERWLATQ